MADLKLKDGREINFDLEKITIEEYRALFNATQPDRDGDEIVGKTCGLTVDEIGKLSQRDYRRLMMKFFDKAREPLEETDGNPN